MESNSFWLNGERSTDVVPFEPFAKKIISIALLFMDKEEVRGVTQEEENILVIGQINKEYFYDYISIKTT